MTQQTEREFWGGKATPRQFCGRHSPPQPGSQTPSSAHTLLGRFWRRTLLVQSLTWSGVFSLLGSNLVLAQTSPLPDAVVLPTIEDSKPSAAPAPVKKFALTLQSAPAPAIPETLRQKLSLTSAPVRREVPKPEVSTLPAAQMSVPIRSVVEPQTNLPSPVQARPTRLVEKTSTNRRTSWRKTDSSARLASTDYHNAYIDPTKYSIGATSGYEAPSRVVLSERSTGCRAVFRQGQGVPGSLCGTALQRRTRVVARGIHSINTVRLPRPQTPSWAKRSRAVAVGGISPVRVGPISVSASGFRSTQRTPVNSPTGQPGNANTRLLFPITVPAVITSVFGWRIHPITGNQRLHTGTDLGAPLGTPVMAAYAGNVALADFLGGYGLTVVLDHNKFTQQTLYGHLSEIFVQPGERVEQGTVIGRVGSTGNSTGPHLHFETRQMTPEGWVATDSGAELEYALAEMVKALRTAQSSQQPGA